MSEDLFLFLVYLVILFFGLALCGFISDYVLPKFPWLLRLFGELPDWEDEDDD